MAAGLGLDTSARVLYWADAVQMQAYLILFTLYLKVLYWADAVQMQARVGVRALTLRRAGNALHDCALEGLLEGICCISISISISISIKWIMDCRSAHAN